MTKIALQGASARLARARIIVPLLSTPSKEVVKHNGLFDLLGVVVEAGLGAITQCIRLRSEESCLVHSCMLSLLILGLDALLVTGLVRTFTDVSGLLVRKSMSIYHTSLFCSSRSIPVHLCHKEEAANQVQIQMLLMRKTYLRYQVLMLKSIANYLCSKNSHKCTMLYLKG